MKQITKLAFNNIKSNKSKSILIIVAIILTTVLLTSVGIITGNFVQNYKFEAIKNAGNAHAFFKQVDDKELSIIKNHRDIEQFGVSSVIGFQKYGEIETTVGFVDKQSFNMNNNVLVEGRVPSKENEVALDKELLKKLGYAPILGEKITLEYENKDGKKVKDSFVLTGIKERNKSEQLYNRSSIFVSEPYFHKVVKEPSYMTSIRINGEDNLSKEEIESAIVEIGEKIGIKPYDITMNDGYLDYFKPDNIVIVGGVGIGLVVMLTGIIVIYSIFYVSIVQRVQEFGKLRAIGATKKQIKKILFREGAILSSVGVPVGLLLGWLFSTVVLQKVLFAEESVYKFTNPIIMVVVFFVSVCTVYLSILKPMRMAAKVSPIEAIRYQESGKQKKKSKKGHKEITLTNLTTTTLVRNKKRTVMTLLSLSLSGILFITMATVLSGINIEKFTRNSFASDYRIDVDYGNDKEYYLSQKDNPFTSQFISQIEQIKEINKVDVKRTGVVVFENPKGIDLYGERGPIQLELDGMPSQKIKEMEDVLISGEINAKALKNNGIIIGHKALAENLQVKVGDVLALTIFDGDRIFEEEFTIQGILDSHQWLLVDNDVLKKLYKTNTISSIDIYGDEKYEDSITSSLKGITNQDNRLELGTYKEAFTQSKTMFMTFNVVGYSLVIIIGLISFVNLINTMITSMITRKKELGVLQAIGMSNKQLMRMLQIEGFVFTAGTLILSLGVGSVTGYGAFYALKESGASFANYYTYPLGAALILIVAVVIVQVVLSYSVTKHFTKESLVDRVRYNS